MGIGVHFWQLDRIPEDIDCGSNWDVCNMQEYVLVAPLREQLRLANAVRICERGIGIEGCLTGESERW